jgi:hypothetical protein
LFPGDLEGFSKTILKARAHHLQWEAQAAEALKDAYDLNHPILIFQALFISLKIRIGRLFAESLDAIAHESPYTVEPAKRVSPESRFKLQHAGSPSEKATLEEKA